MSAINSNSNDTTSRRFTARSGLMSHRWRRFSPRSAISSPRIPPRARRPSLSRLRRPCRRSLISRALAPPHRTVAAPRSERADGRMAAAASGRSRTRRRRCSPAKRGAVAVAGSGRGGGLVVRGSDSQSRCSQRRACRQHGTRHAPADGQDLAGREPADDGRAAGAGGNSEGGARAEVGSRRSSRVDFDRDDAFITPVALAPAASVAIRSARKAAA